MAGHNGGCKEECLHLKRAMELKLKYNGIPYPVKKAEFIHSLPEE